MKLESINTILEDTEYTRTGGSDEELRCAEYLKSYCEKLGARAWLETFPVDMAVMKKAVLKAGGHEFPCTGYFNCGSGKVEAPFLYLPNTDPASLVNVRGRIVMIDSGVSYFLYHDLLENGALGIITWDGDVNYRDSDIDQKELRGYVRDGADKLLCVNVNASSANLLAGINPSTASIEIEQDEYTGESRNVIAEIPGLTTDGWIVLTAHYDSTSLSKGSYDNMSGCIALLGIMESILTYGQKRYGLRFIFCGSEERGLLGSKAYVAAHEAELGKIALNINLDMLGSVMGRFIACVSAEEKLAGFIEYLCSQIGWGISVRTGVYSSDSTPFADKGVPSVSFARLASDSIAPIHNRYDTSALVDPAKLSEDIDFLIYFTEIMASAVKCPVSREIPESVKNELDEYLNRKRKEH